MYAQLIETGERTLTTSRMLCAQAEGLRATTRAVLLRYRAHRLGRLSGSSDAHVRDVLREFCSGMDQPKSYVGYSRGSRCEACGKGIELQEIEYDVVTPAGALRLDATCYGLFLEASREDEHEPSS